MPSLVYLLFTLISKCSKIHVMHPKNNQYIRINKQKAEFIGDMKNVNVNVTDTILWQGHHDRVMQLNYFCGICQMMPLKVWSNTALGCNH